MMHEARDTNAGVAHGPPQSTFQVEMLWHLRTRLHVTRANEFRASRRRCALKVFRELRVDWQHDVDVALRPLLAVASAHHQSSGDQVHVRLFQACDLASTESGVKNQREGTADDWPIARPRSSRWMQRLPEWFQPIVKRDASRRRVDTAKKGQRRSLRAQTKRKTVTANSLRWSALTPQRPMPSVVPHRKPGSWSRALGGSGLFARDETFSRCSRSVVQGSRPSLHGVPQ